MINKDYILRIAERLGRELSIIMGLRERKKSEEALIYIDDLFLQMVGLTTRFINSISEEMLIKALSPLGTLNAEKCLWVADLLKMEGDIYAEMGKSSESYYRYHKSLYLLLTVLSQEPIEQDSPFYNDIRELLRKLADYELPYALKHKLLWYYEQSGQYAKAEDTLFDLLETSSTDNQLRTDGEAFYRRLQAKNDADLQAGNLSREEVDEGISQLQQYNAQNAGEKNS